MNWPTFEQKPQACPRCQTVHDATTAVQHDASPRVGDLTVCVDCGAFLRFGPAFELELVSAEAFDELPEESQQELLRVQWAIRMVTA